jgi:uncharacterized damage-inducible protein DinB
MSIAQALLPEFDAEMATTRRCLERVPENRLDYKPDPKSMSLGRLAGHVAEMPSWGSVTVNSDALDFAKGEFTPMDMTSRAQILAAFDKIVADSRAALASATDERLMGPWSLKNGETTLMTMPRIGVIRTFVMNHTIHHRGQLSVYLRSVGALVPSIYGPSADEGMAASA